MSCPSSETLSEFAAGLPLPDREAIAAHVDGCAKCQLLLGSALYDTSESLQPARIGRYVILETIGRGGFGTVVAAYDPELDRRLAIKLIPLSGSRQERDAPVAEARSLARLRHPNIVAVHDVGRHENALFIAMEFVRGQSIDSWMTDETPWEQVRNVLVEAARGLQHAHEQGILHLDFKPSNVMVDPDGHAVVIDFGLAWLGGDGPRDTVAGTPGYMAPEVYRDQPLDPRADQFAWCATAYRLLVGDKPFDATTAREYITQVRTGPRPIPDGKRIPGWLRRAITRGLAEKPADRYDDMNALVEAMTPDFRRQRRTWRLAAGSALIAAALAVGATIALRPGPSPEDQQEVRTIVERALHAAEARHYVYPPTDAPDAPTALAEIARLESLEGPISAEARTEAAELRARFARDLLDLGDAYWERPGGKTFAVEFYLGALLFSGDASRRERVPLTDAQVAELRGRAEQLAFDEHELVAGDVLAALSDTDVESALDQVARITEPLPLSERVRLASLAPPVATPESAEPTTAPIPVEPEQPPPEPEALPVEDEPEPPRRPTGRASERPPPAAPEPEPEPEPALEPDIEELLAAGLAHFEAARFSEAAKVYRRAIRAAPRNAAGFAGLARSEHELAAYGDAVKHAERAVELAPKPGRYRVLLGDAYFKVYRVDDALEQYQRAQDAGLDMTSRIARAQRQLDAR